MFGRKARAIVAGVLALVLFSALAFVPQSAKATHNNITKMEFARLFTAEPVAVSGTATTVAYGEFANGEVQSIQWRGVGTSPNFKVEALVSLDGTNYVVPETGGTISTATTDQNWHVAALSIPLCRGVKIKITELGGANTVAVDVLLAGQ